MDNQAPLSPETKDNENELQNEVKKFFIQKDEDMYILTCSKMNNSLILKIKIDKPTSLYYYQEQFVQNKLIALSKVFSFCDNIEESYNLLIDNLIEFEDDLKIDIIDDNIKLYFSLELPTKKKDYVNIIMKRKENKDLNNIISVNNILLKLNSKIELIKKSHNEIEKEIETKQNAMDILINKQNDLEKSLKNTIEEIEEIKQFQSKLENFYQENEKKIDKIVKNQKEILTEIEIIKKEEEHLEKDKMNIVEKNNINKILKSIPEINKELELVKIKQEELHDSLKKNIEKNNKVRNDNILEKENEKINKRKNDDFIKKVMEEIEALKKKNELMEKKINEYEKKSDNFNDSIKNELDKIKYDKIDPKEFVYIKTVSTDLFSKNYYNNRACIFNSIQDDNIYIAYGTKENLNLECFDIINDEKFIIVKELHKDFFDSCRYYLDDNDNKNRDLIITSSLDLHVKVINFKKEESEILLDLNFESLKDEVINTVYFSHDLLLIPFSRSQKLKLYSINSEYITEFGKTGFILGLNKYYINNKKVNYILISNTEGIFVYCLESFSLYHRFIPSIEKKEKESDNLSFGEAYIIEKEERVLLFGPCFTYGYLFVWDFINGNLINAIETISGITDICLWNNKYIFASLSNDISQFILININTMEIEKEFKGETEHYGNEVKVLRHKIKGDYLIFLSIKGKLDLYTIYKD